MGSWSDHLVGGWYVIYHMILEEMLNFGASSKCQELKAIAMSVP